MTETTSVELLEGEIARLRRAVDELSVLNDLVVEIGSSKSSEEIVGAILRKALEAVGAEQGVITLVRRGAEETRHTLLRAGGPSAEHPSYHFSESLMGWMQIHRQPLCVNDPRTDERFRGVRWESSIRSLVSVPMIVRDELMAVLTVYNKLGEGGFTDVDLRLLSILAAQSSQVLESARLREQEASLLKLREELELAARIQARLLPGELPQVEGYEIVATTRPAAAVGGDYYDVVPRGDERLDLCVGDVSGKGIPAALLMAHLQATIRGQACRERTCVHCIERSNDFIFQSTALNKFASLFYARLDASRHDLCFCNAGHNPPLLFGADDEPRRLEASGPPLGMVERGTPGNAGYSEETLPLAPGDLLVVYSDGVTEATDRHGEQLGEPRLVDALRAHRRLPAREVLSGVLDLVHRHLGEREQSDDITLMVVKRTEGGPA